MKRIGRARNAVVVLGVVLAAAACSSDDEPATAADPPPVGMVPQLVSMSGQALPLEPYTMQPDAYAKILGARERLVVQCMSRSGFDLEFPRGTGEVLRTKSEMRYVKSPEDAAAYGYHSPGDVSEPEDEPELTAAEGTALYGEDAAGGCFAEVDAGLDERGVLIQDDELVRTISLEGVQESLQDPRLKDAFVQWSACMKEQGYVYGSPLDAMNDPRWEATEVADALEISTAVADSECMGKTNAVGIWFAVESAYQKRKIEANFEKLEEIRHGLETSIRVANEINLTG